MEKILPILECKKGELVVLDKAAAMFLVNGGAISADDIRVTLKRLVVDDDGKLVKDESGENVKEESLVTAGALITEIKIERIIINSEVS